MASLRAALTGDEPVLCVALTHARTPDFPLLAAAAGYDAIYVDLEHTATAWDTAAMLCVAAAAADIAALIRVPSRAPEVVARALDVGAHGVIAPHIASVVDAEALVDAARFPPRGHRSLSGPNVVTGYAPLSTAERVAVADRETVVVALIESVAGVEAAEAIATVDGIDLLLVGPHDLSAELGIAGQVEHPDVRKAMDQVADACARAGTAFGVAGIQSTAVLAELRTRGLRFISAGTDAQLFTEAATACASRLRALGSEGQEEAQ